MSEALEEPVLKRQRVAKACDTCRLLKSKCDGKQPSCSRCQGYGYSCTYSESRSRQRKRDHDCQQYRECHHVAGALEPLREAVDSYDKLIQSLRSTLPKADWANIDISLASIKARIDATFPPRPQSEALPTQTLGNHRVRSARPSIRSQRYLGEVSDVRFFNLVKQVFQEDDSSDRIDEGMDSYEQDETIPRKVLGEISLELPEPQRAEEYIDIYFSTIHIAYPFIPRSSFLRAYKQVRESADNEDVDASWLALLYIVFAIGAYYTSFPNKEIPASSLHAKYFQRALSLSSSEVIERSLNHVSFLLAQCFYLLAVCQTDRCWTTLGHAIRIGQSIGLHVESADPKHTTGRALLRAETRRRMWYSMYVLDRLVALQLGRPPAVHDDDCHVPLPLRLDDAKIDWECDTVSLDSNERPSAGDYFLSVIEFSKLVGYVLRGLYNPGRQKPAANELLSTRHLDKQLLEWRRSLPRTLRFDLGHTFDKSITFKRQRNMLAIKFHHLRALIHRPYLCPPLLRRHDSTSIALLEQEYQSLVHYENISVSEAQETAHLLHNVVDEKDLVHNFPWWQMISCLICASSILLVASAFTGMDSTNGELDGTVLTEDAETCLKVFEALSVNSDSARVAREMMERLKDGCLRLRNRRVYHIQPNVQTLDELQARQGLTTASRSDNLNTLFHLRPEDALSSAQDWPLEISDSMAWSAQFFDDLQNTSPALCHDKY